MEELFYRFNPWWEKDLKLEYFPRESYLTRMGKYNRSKDIVILTGLRRIGKTTLLKLFIAKLIWEDGIEPRDIFYISLDYYGLEKSSILEIVDAYRKILKIPFSRKIYLFLDEIAYKKDFALQLKNLYDMSNAKIYVSSSSSSVLKDEKALLTGREKIIEVLPLTFEEFLQFRKIKIEKDSAHLTDAYFEDYMKTGGLPEYVLFEDIEYIKQLIDDVLYKDIIAYHNIRSKEPIREFFYLLMERVGKQVSLNKMAKILKIGVDTAKRYLDYFRETYLIYTVERCEKLNERLRAPKKVYAGDIGMRNALTGFRDKGALFENLVYYKIKDKNPCYLYRNKIEIDFLTETEDLIEVKYNARMTQKQRKLFEAQKAKRKIEINNVKDFLNLSLQPADTNQ